MIVFIILAVIAFVLIKFIIYASKSENQIETDDIRKKFKPFIDVIIESYVKYDIKTIITDIDDDKKAIDIQTEYLSDCKDKIDHFLMIQGNTLRIEVIYFIYDLKFREIYTLEVSRMDGRMQTIESERIIKDFHRKKIKFQEENELEIIQEMTNRFLYK